jgi:hypothetical protein
MWVPTTSRCCPTRCMSATGTDVRGSITIGSGNTVGPDRILVQTLRATVENHSTQPALDVMYRHAEHWPNFSLLASAIPPGGFQQSELPVEPRFEIAYDNTKLIPGTEVKYQLGGVVWIRRGKAPPVSSVSRITAPCAKARPLSS